MSNNRRLFASLMITAGLLSVLAAETAQVKVPAPTASKTFTIDQLGIGWQCLVVPTPFEGPGTIFSVDGDGRPQDEVNLADSHPRLVQTAPTAIGRISDKAKTEGQARVSWLEKLASFGGHVSAEATKVDEDIIEYRDVTEERTGSDLDDQVKNWFRGAKKKVRSDRRYFVVRNAYTAKYVHYHFTKGYLAAIDADVKVKNIFGVEAKVGKGADSGYDLDQRFEKPVRVCVQASEVVQERGANGEAGDYVPRKHVGDVPVVIWFATEQGNEKMAK
jgi:hypothetical protein